MRNKTRCEWTDTISSAKSTSGSIKIADPLEKVLMFLNEKGDGFLDSWTCKY